MWDFQPDTAKQTLQPAQPGVLPESGALTNIAEFNDCQRFILRDATGQGERYDSLYAIFVGQNLKDDAEFPIVPVDSSDTAHVRVDTALVLRGEAVATIYSLGGTYEPLGIKPGLNCLYLSRTHERGPFRAAIASIPTGECSAHHYVPGTVKELKVVANSIKAAGADDYPLAARWQLDARGRYVAGLPCGAAWCQLGAPDFQRVAARPQPVGGVLSNSDLIRFAIDGWYDEQSLAVPAKAPASDGSTPIVPGAISGIVVPFGDIGSYDAAAFAGRTWLPVARIFLRAMVPLTWAKYSDVSRAFSSYRSKLNMVGPNFEGSAPRLGGTVIELCMGDARRCRVTASPLPPEATDRQEQAGLRLEKNWWARITPPSGVPAYRRVLRCAHPEVLRELGFGVPATARWRWQADDETVWVRCLEGCCEVHPWDPQ